MKKATKRKIEKRGSMLPRFKKLSDSVAYLLRLFEGKTLKESYQGLNLDLDVEEPLID